MDAAAELGRNLVSKHQIQPEYGDEQTEFSGANADREISMFPVQLTHTRAGLATLPGRFILLLYVCVIPYIHTMDTNQPRKTVG